MKQFNVIEAPKVREILTKLRAAREQHSAIVAEKMGADSEADRLGSEIGQATAQRDAKEKAMAIAGDVPEDAGPEELQMGRLARQRRVALAKVSIVEERVADSQQVIEALKKQIDAAWLQLGAERCQELIARFRQAALALRKIQCEHRAWVQWFSNKPGIPNCWVAIVIDPCGTQGVVNGDDGLIFDGRMVDSRMLGNENYWKPLGGDLAESIRALLNEVEAAKAE